MRLTKIEKTALPQYVLPLRAKRNLILLRLPRKFLLQMNFHHFLSMHWRLRHASDSAPRSSPMSAAHSASNSGQPVILRFMHLQRQHQDRRAFSCRCDAYLSSQQRAISSDIIASSILGLRLGTWMSVPPAHAVLSILVAICSSHCLHALLRESTTCDFHHTKQATKHESYTALALV